MRMASGSHASDGSSVGSIPEAGKAEDVIRVNTNQNRKEGSFFII